MAAVGGTTVVGNGVQVVYTFGKALVGRVCAQIQTLEREVDHQGQFAPKSLGGGESLKV